MLLPNLVFGLKKPENSEFGSILVSKSEHCQQFLTQKSIFQVSILPEKGSTFNSSRVVGSY
jgi:hypothetical protein